MTRNRERPGWPALPDDIKVVSAGEPVIIEGPEAEAILGLGIGDDHYAINSAGRPMRIPWDAELGKYEPAPDDPLWWLSFCDTDRRAGSQFLGVAIVQAPTFAAAITRSHVLGVNPGGEVASEGPLPAEFIAAEYRDRLLTRAEAEAIPEPEGL